MKTSCTCGWVGVGEAPWIDIRARGWDIDDDVRSRQALPLLGHTGCGAPEWQWRVAHKTVREVKTTTCLGGVLMKIIL